MNNQTAREITSIWEMMEAANPDRSTEWLLEATSIRVAQRTLHRHADSGDVAEALLITSNFIKAKKKHK